MRGGDVQAKSTLSTVATPPANSSNSSGSPAPPPPTLSEREQLKQEFYKTYDVMTGVRIAATLGGFFSLMVFFVVYKSRCGRGGKSISSSDVAAAAAELDAVPELPFDGFYSLTAPRRSLGNVSAPAAMRTSRAASYAYSDSSMLWGPPTSQPSRGSFLVVPGVRLSSTGSSSDSSYYLEHHGSVELSLPPAPRPRRCWRRSTIAAAAQEVVCTEGGIDINVIQPTPDVSPCGSERQLYRQQLRIAAPLASFSVSEADSVGSDSVFEEDEEAAATCESSSDTESSDEVCSRPQPSSRFLQVPCSRWRPPQASLPLRQTGGSEEPDPIVQRTSAETLF
jgi:hypothetical protein